MRTESPWDPGRGERDAQGSATSSHRVRRSHVDSPDEHVDAICVAQCYDASAARIFNAWLDPDCAGRWLFATASRPMTRVEIDARVGGLFCLADGHDAQSTRHCGTYLQITRYRRLVFTLVVPMRPRALARVEVNVAALPQGCRLKLIHHAVPRDLRDYMEGRWAGILYGLGETLDCNIATFDHQRE